uniref:Replication associated protein n=2 Tax=Lactococcus lactis TaxID=1358 RepID=A0AAC9W6N9_LACLL|nr:helix-turn-helix domain-containing protein [Lactococcus lactis subsp. lactis]
MSEELKTIKELADELGVSKTAINKKVTDRERKLWFSKIGNKFVINESGQKAIKRMFASDNENREPKTRKPERKLNSQTENFKNNNDDNENNADIKYILDIIEYQKEQIKDLQNTKEEQFKQLSNMQNLLDQQQRLALQDKKLLEEYKAENDTLKALQSPSQNFEKEQPKNQLQEENKALKSKIKTLQEQFKEQTELKSKESQQKWWNFWK